MTTPGTSAPEKAHKNSHKMGLWMAAIVGMNAMIGASIFIIPAQLQRSVGPAAILSYLFVIAAIWCIAYSLAQVATYHPEEGSFFAYARLWAGQAGGLIAAGFYCVGLIVALGLLTRVTGTYLHTQFSTVSTSMLATVMLIGLTVSLLAGKRIARWGQIILLFFTVAPLLVIAFLCLTKASLTNMQPFMPFGWNSVLKATKIVIFGFFGFEAITAIYPQVAKPETTVPRAITISIFLVSLLYLFFVVSVFLALPQSLFAGDTNLPDVLYKTFAEYPWLITVVVWGIIITIMGTIHSMIWSVAMLLKSLTEMINLPFVLSMNNAIIILSFCVWVCSIAFANVDLFFNVTALGIITALAMAIMPVALRTIPVRRTSQIIAWLGLLTALVMCGYAVDGIWNYIVG